MKVVSQDSTLYRLHRIPTLFAAGVLAFLVAPSLSFAQSPDERSQYGEGYSSGYEEMAGEQMEMELEDEEEGYGEGYFSGMEGMEDGGGGFGGQRTTRRTPTVGGGSTNAMVQPYSSAMTALLGSVDLTPLLAPPNMAPQVQAGPVLSADAEHAYRNGNYPLGLELYFGHLVAEYDQAAVNLQTVKYSKLLRRPAWQIRWAVSFAVRGATEVKDPQPIQEGKTPNNRMTAGGGGYGGDEDGFAGPAAGGLPGYGEEEMDMEMEMEMEMPGYGAQGGGPPRQSTRQRSQPQREMLSAEAKEDMESYLGLVATVVAEEFDKRYRQGDFGPALVTVAAPEPVVDQPRGAPPAAAAPAMIGSMSQAVMDALDDSPEPRPLWKPGIMYYGEGDSKDIAKIAKRDGVDMLLHFDIFLKNIRDEYVQNVSRARILRVADAKSLGVSKGMDSFEAMNLVRNGRGSERDYVMTQMENLLGLIDRYVATSDFPKLTPEIAKRRVGSLLSGSQARSLRTLAEIRLYQVQQLITPEEVEAAFDIVGGQEALLMLYGPTQERLSMAREWALRAVPSIDE